MDKIYQEIDFWAEQNEQRSQRIVDPFQNPDADRLALEILVEELHQPENLGQLATTSVQMPITQDTDENQEVEQVKVDEAENASVSPEEMAPEMELAKITKSTHSEVDLEINVEDVVDISDALPGPSQQQNPSTSKYIGKKEMAKEEATLQAQVVKQEVKGRRRKRLMGISESDGEIQGNNE